MTIVQLVGKYTTKGSTVSLNFMCNIIEKLIPVVSTQVRHIDGLVKQQL